MSAVGEQELKRASRREIRPGIRTAASLLISLAAIGAVVWWALRQKAPTFPSGVGPISILVGGIAAYAIATVIRGIRWSLVLELAGIEHERTDALALVPVGYMGNTVLPAIAGEILRMLLLKARSSASRREIFGSIIAERTLDAVTLALLFAVMTTIGIAGAPTGRGAALIAAGVLVVGALGAVVLLAIRRRGRFERFASVARPFLRATKLLLCARGVVLGVITAAVWLLEGFIYWLVARSLELPVNYIDSVYLVVLASIVAMVPAAPGYLGTVDAAIIFGLGAIGIKGGQALSFAILVRFIIFVPITIVGLLLMVIRYGGLGKLRVHRMSEVEEEGRE
ncbi:MAG: lysylphosphatidylglycerol synthase transmembrane domain-containing protein [Gaiellaceae bacterium]|jgi:uncharacterized protein (TIRG00374 family)